jgi:hypothetical protein
METARNLRIAHIEIALTLLRQHERRLKAILRSTLSSPEIMVQAHQDRAEVINKIEAATEELKRLENEI